MFFLKGRSLRMLISLAVVMTMLGLSYLIFQNGEIDQKIAGLFYNKTKDGSPWFMKDCLWLLVCYKGVSVVTAIVGVSVIIGTILSCKIEKLRKYKAAFLLVLISLILGPGLIVNAVFKDNWGRPRPRDTVQFGGDFQYQSPWVISEKEGKSFPCGHCSVPFALSCLTWLINRRYSYRRVFVFALCTSIGLIVGLSRIAVGAHYLSDVIVSGVISVSIPWVLVKLCPQFGAETGRRWRGIEGAFLPTSFIIGTSVLLSFVALMVVLAAWPHDSCRKLTVSPSEHGVYAGDVLIVSIEAPLKVRGGMDALTLINDENLEFEGQSRGFGFPWSRVNYKADVVIAGGQKTLQISRQKIGFFAELHSEILMHKGKI